MDAKIIFKEGIFMIQLTNLTAQVLQPGQALTFDEWTLKSGNCECWTRQIPQSVKLKAPCGSIYEVEFSGNITSGTAGQALQLAIAAAGQPMRNTAMNATPSVANGLQNVHTATLFRDCCGDANRLSVVNTSAVPVTVAPNSAFIVMRKS